MFLAPVVYFAKKSAIFAKNQLKWAQTAQKMKIFAFSRHLSIKVIYFEYIPGKTVFLASVVHFARKSAIFAKNQLKWARIGQTMKNFTFSRHFSIKVIYFEYIPGKTMFLASVVHFE